MSHTEHVLQNFDHPESIFIVFEKKLKKIQCIYHKTSAQIQLIHKKYHHICEYVEAKKIQRKSYKLLAQVQRILNIFQLFSKVVKTIGF